MVKCVIFYYLSYLLVILRHSLECFAVTTAHQLGLFYGYFASLEIALESPLCTLGEITLYLTSQALALCVGTIRRFRQYGKAPPCVYPCVMAQAWLGIVQNLECATVCVDDVTGF